MYALMQFGETEKFQIWTADDTRKHLAAALDHSISSGVRFYHDKAVDHLLS